MAQLRQETEKADADTKKKEHDIKNPGLGYGGKFGIEKDRMDKSAEKFDYIGKGMVLTQCFRFLFYLFSYFYCESGTELKIQFY